MAVLQYKDGSTWKGLVRTPWFKSYQVFSSSDLTIEGHGTYDVTLSLPSYDGYQIFGIRDFQSSNHYCQIKRLWFSDVSAETPKLHLSIANFSGGSSVFTYNVRVLYVCYAGL